MLVQQILHIFCKFCDGNTKVEFFRNFYRIVEISVALLKQLLAPLSFEILLATLLLTFSASSVTVITGIIFLEIFV